MRSTPVVGGGLFGEGHDDTGGSKEDAGAGRVGGEKPTKSSGGKNSSSSQLLTFKPSGHAAEIIVYGESYKIRINDETLRHLRTGYSGEMMDSRGISVAAGMTIQHDESNVVNRLHGYVRNVGPLGKITEETGDEASETSGDFKGSSQAGGDGAV